MEDKRPPGPNLRPWRQFARPLTLTSRDEVI